MTPPEHPYDWEDDESFVDEQPTPEEMGWVSQCPWDGKPISEEEAEIEAIGIEMQEGDLITLSHEYGNWTFKLKLNLWDDVAERLAQEASLWLITQE